MFGTKFKFAQNLNPKTIRKHNTKFRT
jgi:hypothetical protein